MNGSGMGCWIRGQIIAVLATFLVAWAKHVTRSNLMKKFMLAYGLKGYRLSWQRRCGTGASMDGLAPVSQIRRQKSS